MPHDHTPTDKRGRPLQMHEGFNAAHLGLPDDGTVQAALRRALALALHRIDTPHPDGQKAEGDERLAMACLLDGTVAPWQMRLISSGLAGASVDQGPSLDDMVAEYDAGADEVTIRAWSAKTAEVIDFEAHRQAALHRDQRWQSRRVLAEAAERFAGDPLMVASGPRAA